MLSSGTSLTTSSGVATDWAFIAKVSTENSAVASFEGYITSEYNSYKVVFDSVSSSANNSLILMTLSVGGAQDQNTIYGWTTHHGSSSSVTGGGNTSTYWPVTNANYNDPSSGEILISGADGGTKASASWHTGSGINALGSYTVGGGTFNNAGQLSGVYFKNNNGNFGGGQMYLFGLNRYD